MSRLAIAESLVSLLVPGAHLVEPAYETVAVRESDGEKIYMCGTGPESAMGYAEANPNWLYWRAANLLAIADRIRKDAQ